MREELYYGMCLIRTFEERILELFSEGRLFGTTHTGIGQEANAVGVMSPLLPQDIVVSNHRCHGHYIARTGDVGGLMAELMGKAGGVCGGRGGSQHLHRGNFYTNGIQGNMAPVAVGMVFAEKTKASNAVCVLFVGDGTFGEGALYEALNMASLWRVPLLVVVENNRYAQSTPIHLNLAGDILLRARAFGIEASEMESNHVEEVLNGAVPLVEKVRCEQKPHVHILHTYRLSAHSKGDDFRDPDEIMAWREKDPLDLLGREFPADTVERLKEKARRCVADAERAAAEMEFASLRTRTP